MDTVLSAVRLALWIAGIWTVLSILACIPLSALLAESARADASREREYRRLAWLSACRRGRRVAARNAVRLRTGSDG